MVKHMILWKLKDEFNDEQKAVIKAGVKEGLEGLLGQVPGLTEIKVITNGTTGSNCDMMLDSTFVDIESWEAYKTHPAHEAVANEKVRPYTVQRMCLNFEV